MGEYQDIYYKTADGLTLYARDYPNEGRPVILCLHGLTRNSSDFENIAPQLHKDYRVIAADQRGRGRSAYDPNPLNYRPDIYCEDMLVLCAQLGLKRISIIGTSMGGIMAMILAGLKPDLLQAIVLNDIGPEIDPKGLTRISAYVGTGHEFDSWEDAARAVRASNEIAFPDYNDDDWMAFGKRLCREAGGGVKFAYDPDIANAFNSDGPAPDMWPLFEALKSIPLLITRGQTSDLLSQDVFEKMLAVHPNASGYIVKDVGHAPMLDEGEAMAAITKFLGDKIAENY